MKQQSLEVDSVCWCLDSRMSSGQDSKLDALTGQLKFSFHHYKIPHFFLPFLRLQSVKSERKDVEYPMKSQAGKLKSRIRCVGSLDKHLVARAHNLRNRMPFR